MLIIFYVKGLVNLQKILKTDVSLRMWSVSPRLRALLTGAEVGKYSSSFSMNRHTHKTKHCFESFWKTFSVNVGASKAARCTPGVGALVTK